MSIKKDIDHLEVAEFCMKVSEGIQRGVSPDEMMEIMLVHHVVSKAKGRGITSMTDGYYTIQCVVNNPNNEQPRKKK